MSSATFVLNFRWLQHRSLPCPALPCPRITVHVSAASETASFVMGVQDRMTRAPVCSLATSCFVLLLVLRADRNPKPPKPFSNGKCLNKAAIAGPVIAGLKPSQQHHTDSQVIPKQPKPKAPKPRIQADTFRAPRADQPNTHNPKL